MSNNNNATQRRRQKIEQDAVNWKGQERYIDHLVQLAAQNPCEGILQEPRGYYDVLPVFPSTTQSVFNNDAPFMNGEKYPVMITHMTAALRPDFDASPAATGLNDEDIQRMGMRMVWDDTYYETDQFLALPNWHNRVATNASSLGRSSSHYVFDRPLILTSRDSLAVQVQLLDAPASGHRRVEVCFEGTGLLSMRPYTFSAFVDLTTEVSTILDTERFINGGSEPIALTDMTMFVSAESTDGSGQGDIRQAALSVRVIGNGTQAAFFQGPNDPTIALLMPAPLLGVTTGRAIVHGFPGEGMRMEPGDSLRIEAIAFDGTAVGLQLAVALHGYLTVT